MVLRDTTLLSSRQLIIHYCINCSIKMKFPCYVSGIKIKMTAPVLKKMSRACDTCESTNTMYFMIPAKHKNNPPAPTNSAAYLVNMPAMDVYVRYVSCLPRPACASERKRQTNILRRLQGH